MRKGLSKSKGNGASSATASFFTFFLWMYPPWFSPYFLCCTLRGYGYIYVHKSIKIYILVSSPTFWLFFLWSLWLLPDTRFSIMYRVLASLGAKSIIACVHGHSSTWLWANPSPITTETNEPQKNAVQLNEMKRSGWTNVRNKKESRGIPSPFTFLSLGMMFQEGKSIKWEKLALKSDSIKYHSAAILYTIFPSL